MTVFGQAKQLIEESTIGNKPLVLDALKPALKMTATRCHSIEPGKSKFGGTPDLPQEFAWPRDDSGELDFLLQLDLTELAGFPGSENLPSSGFLYFFGSPRMDGCNKTDEQYSAVLYYDGKRNTLKNRPAECTDRTWQSCSISLETTWTIDSYLRVPQEDFDEFWNVLERLTEEPPIHQLLGFPYVLQPGYDMPDECDRFRYADSDCPDSEKHHSDWILLSQIVSDPDGPGFCWGDNGIVYFWIKSEDLKARRFDRHWHFKQSC